MEKSANAPKSHFPSSKNGAKNPIETTLELVDIIRASMPGKRCARSSIRRRGAFRRYGSPKRRTWTMAVCSRRRRIGLNKKGRLCIISFQSLEDKLVKVAVHKREKGCICPPDFPVCGCGFVPTLKSITKSRLSPGPKKSYGTQGQEVPSSGLRSAYRKDRQVMATHITNTQPKNIKYASRSAVYGSNAYDLSRVRNAAPRR